MDKKIGVITDKIEHIAMKLNNLSATALMLAALNESSSEVVAKNIISDTFQNIADQTGDLSVALYTTASDIMKASKPQQQEDHRQDPECDRDIDKAIREGMELVQKIEPLDLNAAEIMELYDRYEKCAAKKNKFDAITDALHDAFLVGTVFGLRWVQQEMQQKDEETK